MDKDREAFEAFARKNTMIDLRRNDLEPSFYEVYATQDAWRLWQAALAYARQNGEVCLSCGTHSMNARCDCTRLGSSELRRPAVCVSPPGKD